MLALPSGRYCQSYKVGLKSTSLPDFVLQLQISLRLRERCVEISLLHRVDGFLEHHGPCCTPMENSRSELLLQATNLSYEAGLRSKRALLLPEQFF